MRNDPSQSIQFADSPELPIPADAYFVTVTQIITDLDTAQVLGTYPATPKKTKVYVLGNRLSVDPLDIDSFFPPDGDSGDYGDVLPHISFSRKALPWEQRSGVDEAPWLALLVFHQADEGGIPQIKPAVLGDLLRSDYQPQDPLAKKVRSSLTIEEERDKKLTIATYNDAVTTALWIRPSENAWDPCMVVDIPVSLFLKIAPRKEDLRWLAHTRIDSTTSGSREFSAVIANRLPQREGLNMACLVSLEHMAKFMMPQANITTDGKAATHIRLIVLKSWSFKSGAGLRGFYRDLKTGPLKIPSVAALPAETPSDALVKNALAMGYTALDHSTRWGDRTVSWYRGPFLPFSSEITQSIPLPPVDESGYSTDTTPLSSADEALRYDPETGMLDVSYAAAWQLGRLMALRDTTFASDLYRWKRENKQKILQSAIAGDIFAMLIHLMSAAARQTTPVDAARELLDDSIRLKDRLKDAKAPDSVLKRLNELRRLEGVPLDYLVPDERMLPPDTLRFFQVDPNWIYSLIEGAYSIGRISTSDQKQDKATCVHSPYKQISGFLLRSAIVSGWPTLQVRVEVSSPSEIRELRCQRITPDILLYMVEVEGPGVITAVNVHVPPESLEFHLPKRKTVDFLDAGKSVVDIDKLARGGKTDSTPAKFARELVASFTPVLAWKNEGHILSLTTEAGNKDERQEWQFLVNGKPFREPASLIVPASATGSAIVTLQLFDDLPSGEIAVRIRPAVSASRRWATSAALNRPGAHKVQPKLTYSVVQETVIANWAPDEEVNLEAQLVCTSPYNKISSPVGGIVKATQLTVAGGIPTGEVHVRFRPLGTTNSLPGEWLTSQASLISLQAPKMAGGTDSYIEGVFTGVFYDEDYNIGVTHGSTLEMYLTTSERGVTNPVYKAPAKGGRVEFIVKPENAPGGSYIRMARVMGEDNRFITSPFSLTNVVKLLAKPVVTLTSPATVSWKEIAGVAYYICVVLDVSNSLRSDFTSFVHPSPNPSLDLSSMNLGPGRYRVQVTPNGEPNTSWTGPYSDPVFVTIT